MLESIRKIIVPTDFSELSECALRTAAELAHQDDASVYLLHSIRLPFFHTNYDINVPEAVWEGLRQGTEERMSESRAILEEAGVSQVELIVTESRQPAEALEQSVRELGADLVVMATHGRRGFKHAFLGSVTEQTLRRSPVPVLAVKENGLTEMPIKRILLATDFSSHSKKAAELAARVAHRFGAHVDVVHTLEKIPDYLVYESAEAMGLESQGRAIAIENLEEVGDALEKENISSSTHLVDGVASDAIADEADRLGSDLIVMGTHGYTGFTHAMLGSVAERTLRLAPCSILMTRDFD